MLGRESAKAGEDFVRTEPRASGQCHAASSGGQIGGTIPPWRRSGADARRTVESVTAGLHREHLERTGLRAP
jgi:hypothetical protein